MNQLPDQESDETRHDRIRRSRNNVFGLLMGAFAILIFFISIAKMT